MKKLALSLFLFAAVAVFGGGAFSQAEAAKTETAEIRKAIEDYRARFIRLVEEQAAVLKTDLGLFE